MGRAGRLKRPYLPDGPHKELNDWLHDLHRRAQSPSTSVLAAALAARGVPDASRTTIYNAFSHPRLPMAQLVDALVVELLGRIKGIPPEQVDSISSTLSQLWIQADDEDRAKHQQPTTAPIPIPPSPPLASGGSSLFDDLPLPGFESPANPAGRYGLNEELPSTPGWVRITPPPPY